MKTILIDDGDEASLAAALSAAGLDKYADRVKTAGGLCVVNVMSFGEPYETTSGPSGWADYSSPWGFATTGAIQSVADLQANNANYSSVCTVGWFRAPDGHLCSSDCYPKYFTT